MRIILYEIGTVGDSTTTYPDRYMSEFRFRIPSRNGVPENCSKFYVDSNRMKNRGDDGTGLRRTGEA